MTPIPPALAIAIAISDSVTVSIAADENGTLSGIPRVKNEPVLTSFGCTSECRGVRRTSSKVSTTSVRTRVNVSSTRVDPLMRESPLPDFAGVAGLVDGRVVVAIAKCMALFVLRPEVRVLRCPQALCPRREYVNLRKYPTAASATPQTPPNAAISRKNGILLSSDALPL